MKRVIKASTDAKSGKDRLWDKFYDHIVDISGTGYQFVSKNRDEYHQEIDHRIEKDVRKQISYTLNRVFEYVSKSDIDLITSEVLNKMESDQFAAYKKYDFYDEQLPADYFEE